jgi:hypothetical protein
MMSDSSKPQSATVPTPQVGKEAEVKPLTHKGGSAKSSTSSSAWKEFEANIDKQPLLPGSGGEK